MARRCDDFYSRPKLKATTTKQRHLVNKSQSSSFSLNQCCLLNTVDVSNLTVSLFSQDLMALSKCLHWNVSEYTFELTNSRILIEMSRKFYFFSNFISIFVHICIENIFIQRTMLANRMTWTLRQCQCQCSWILRFKFVFWTFEWTFFCYSL